MRSRAVLYIWAWCNSFTRSARTSHWPACWQRSPIRCGCASSKACSSRRIACPARKPRRAPTWPNRPCRTIFAILREAGLIQTSKKGVEHRNVVARSGYQRAVSEIAEDDPGIFGAGVARMKRSASGNATVVETVRISRSLSSGRALRRPVGIIRATPLRVLNVGIVAHQIADDAINIDCEHAAASPRRRSRFHIRDRLCRSLIGQRANMSFGRVGAKAGFAFSSRGEAARRLS